MTAEQIITKYLETKTPKGGKVYGSAEVLFALQKFGITGYSNKKLARGLEYRTKAEIEDVLRRKDFEPESIYRILDYLDG